RFIYCFTQQQHEEISAKKVRLTKPSKSAALHVDLCKATSPADALQYLLQFARKPVEAESVEGVVRILLEHYYKETDPSVRLKIASLLGLLSKTPGFSPDCILDDVINTLQTEKSHQVLAQLLDTLLVIGKKLQENPAVRGHLVDVACKRLWHKPVQVVPVVLSTLGAVPKDLDVQKIIGDHFSDQDPRVRSAAIKAMLQLHERGLKLQQAIYNQVMIMSYITLAKVQLTWVLSQLYAESIVPIPSSNEEIRLVDDAFGKICHMVSDGSWVVRVQAAKLLGSMQQVSSHFLEQTLDKKLMSDLRVQYSVLFSAGNGGRPKEEIDTGAVNLIESGAYVVSWEIYRVLCPSFAEKCLDFLVDMFNDEIEEVRLRSIHTMRKISNNITLEAEEQLEPVPSVRMCREALHELLCCTNVSTREVFLCCRHPTLVLPLVPELLGTHPFFDTPEPDMDDPAYIAVLVLIFNAAKSCPTMPALFSDHTFRHYAYLRDSLSHLVPPLRLPGKKMASSSGPASLTLQEDPSQEFLQQSLERVFNLQHLDPQGTQELLEFTIRDLQRFGELQSDLAGMADFSATYLRCQLLLIKALQEKLWNVAAPLYVKQNALALAAARQIMEETYKMEFMYSNVEHRQVVIIHHMRLQAKALQLIVTVRTTRGVEPLGICEKFLQEVDCFQRCFISELPHMQGSFVDKLLDLMPRLVTSKPSEVVKILRVTLRQSNFLRLPLPEKIHRATATIIEPTGESDNPLRFTSGLVVALDVDATLEHVQDPQSTVKVQIMYPDGQSQVIHPKPADFRNPGPGRHRLITQVYLSHTAWTEPCQIELRLLLAYSSDRTKVSVGLSRSTWGDSTDLLPPSEGSIEGTLLFGKPVKVYIMPKPARR
uniref:Integrator complex subunit 4 n=1 Tax=Naja naja TaxID=35670 RepID=A0A8C6XHW7_NAJNA